MPGRPTGKAAGASALAAAAFAAAIAVVPHTRQAEGEKLVAYQDQGGVWTDCSGRTSGVKRGDRSSVEECRAWLQAELLRRTTAVLELSPELVDQPGPLQAAGDFAFNAGMGWYTRSPMRRLFAQRRFAAGCDAFVGYVVRYRAPRPVPGQHCARNSKGILYCEARGLVQRRRDERAICLKGLK